jgi:hypothetical protein
MHTLLKEDYIKEDGKFEKLLTFIQELRFRYGDDDISKENRKNIIEPLFNIYKYIQIYTTMTIINQVIH